jgi:hypothetical protein
MKTFDIEEAPDDIDEEDFDVVEFTIRTKAFVMRAPNSETVMALSSAFGLGQEKNSLAAMRNFLENHLLDNGARTIIGWWEDPRDKFGYQNLLEIITWAFEQVAENPTQPSSASASPPRATGQRSTGRAPGKGSTRSTSRRTASAT